ncbi:hypothetical protein T8T21_14650 [Limimaricola variabilis]|uniref:protein kinase domain-containing protein n=1 Tax=Limimaricola variabilis TaxID=1492771 RepID=UPI002AC8C262|nr:hypothetical protein [Limimaricola variabilis]WPY94326.1 hypothetical protein T8T21_14650 [Limimaricola variabilis]
MCALPSASSVPGGLLCEASELGSADFWVVLARRLYFFGCGFIRGWKLTDLGVAGALRLEGRTLGSGWKVLGAVGWDPSTGLSKEIYNGTGGNFSKAYRVEKDGKHAFLKAIDLTRPLQEPDVMSALLKVSSEHRFEVDILNVCSGARLDRIVVALDSGEERLGPSLHDVVPYLIFELAEGDVRKKIGTIDPKLKISWWLRALHHAAVGLNQLHSKSITHQDLKPSNILSFGNEGGFKLGDLGRSTCENKPGPFDNMIFSGDRSYAPPEILYNFIIPDVFQRRQSCDCYMLGSMIFYFVSGSGLTRLMLQRLPVDNLPFLFGGGWQGSYRSILPVLQSVFSDCLNELELAVGDSEVGKELVTCARQLSNPDPALRGHPLTRASSARVYSLERYVSVFDRLAKRAAIEARRGV